MEEDQSGKVQNNEFNLQFGLDSRTDGQALCLQTLPGGNTELVKSGSPYFLLL